MSQWAYDNAEPEYYRDDYECSELKKLKAKLQDVSEFFEAIIESLYGKGHLDVALLEFQLDEVAYKLGVDVDYKTLNIERKNQTIGSIAHFLSITSPHKIPA